MEVLNCICGCEAEMKCVKHHEVYLVKCTQVACWHGRSCTTEKEAVTQWNGVMGVVAGLTILFRGVLS
jgi:hypothetical protein